MGDAVEVEITNGRWWRAKEILRGRLADADYDPSLFAQYAGVLVAMHDDDEAGRFYLLAGHTDGPGGKLARAYLARRSAVAFTQLWSDMPTAARRGTTDTLPPGTRELLREAGFVPRQVEAHLGALQRRREKQASLREKTRRSKAEEARGQRIGLVMASILLVVLAVGVIGTMRLLWWGIATVAGLG